MPDVARARSVIEAARGRAALTEDEAKQVLTCFGLRVPRRIVVPFGDAAGAGSVRSPFPARPQSRGTHDPA